MVLSHSIGDLVARLNLVPHPEGGFFAETYRAGEQTASLPDRFATGPNEPATRHFGQYVSFIVAFFSLELISTRLSQPRPSTFS